MTSSSDFSLARDESILENLLNSCIYILLLEGSIFYHSLDRYIIFSELVWKWSDILESLSKLAFSEAKEIGLKEQKLNLLKFFV
jgi:hypothetical protein